MEILSNEELIKLAESEENKDNILAKKLAERLKYEIHVYGGYNDSPSVLMSQKMADFVNKYDNNKSFNEFNHHMLFCEHRTLQQNYMKLIMSSIKAFSELDDNQIDDRNKYSRNLAVNIMRLLKENNVDVCLPLI